MWNLIDSHDTARFLHLCDNNKKKQHLAAAFQLLLPGMPMIYYGDEFAMPGANDQDCRRGMYLSLIHISVEAVGKADVDTLVEEYYDKYQILLEGRDEAEFRRHVAVQAQIEIGFERFLEEKNYPAIVTHFGDLGSLKQLPGLAIQRLMQKGYGFGGEGDWKTAAMVRLDVYKRQQMCNSSHHLKRCENSFYIC